MHLILLDGIALPSPYFAIQKLQGIKINFLHMLEKYSLNLLVSCRRICCTLYYLINRQ